MSAEAKRQGAGRVAVLGGGSIGRRHLANLQSLGVADLVAYDPSADACSRVERELGVAAFSTLEAVWPWGPEIVVVAAPTQCHVALALQAALRGCHLFIEKPLSYSLDGVESLRVEVERRRLVTMVGCNMRFHPGPAAVKNLLGAGAIGPVLAARLQTGSYLPRWRPGQDYRRSYSASTEWGGAIFDCIHEIDLALWLFGPAVVVGAARRPATSLGLETEGLAEMLLRHRDGVLSSVHMNFVQRDYRRTCQVIGAEGTVYWDFAQKQVTRFDADGHLAQTLPEPEGWEVNQMYRDELSHFLEAVRDGTETVNPLAGGMAALRIAQAARQSSVVS